MDNTTPAPKQVIVMRKDLNMRKGKMVAQGAHASMAVILNLLQTEAKYYHWGAAGTTETYTYHMELHPQSPIRQWLTDKFTKICVSVDSEQELIDIYNKAREANIPSALITDSGLTEFNGVPTNTCCAVGPWHAEEIDKITGHLKLL